MPKQDEGDGNAASHTAEGQAAHGEATETQEPAIPLQTLSREQAGLKPPDYETHVRAVDEERRHSQTSEPGSSSQAEQRT